MEMLFMHFYAKQLCWLNWVCLCGECVTSSHVLLLVWTDTHICKFTSWNSTDSSEWLNKMKCFFCGKRVLSSLGLKDNRSNKILTTVLHDYNFRHIFLCILNIYRSLKSWFSAFHLNIKHWNVPLNHVPPVQSEVFMSFPLFVASCLNPKTKGQFTICFLPLGQINPPYSLSAIVLIRPSTHYWISMERLQPKDSQWPPNRWSWNGPGLLQGAALVLMLTQRGDIRSNVLMSPFVMHLSFS